MRIVANLQVRYSRDGGQGLRVLYSRVSDDFLLIIVREHANNVSEHFNYLDYFTAQEISIRLTLISRTFRSQGALTTAILMIRVELLSDPGCVMLRFISWIND